MRFELERDVAILSDTPAVLQELLENLANEWTHANYGPNTWSPHQIIGHLIHGERTDWIPRARCILEHGEAVAFEPFDRNGHEELCREYDLPRLLEIFETERRENLDVLRSLPLTPETLSRRGRHPALGSVTLEQLLCTWVVHDLNHIAQVCKALAYQHKKDVGPWEAYLSILAPPAPR